MMSDILHESWLGEMVAGWDLVKKLNAFEERYLAWILLLWDETLVQETKYLALSFRCFSGIMLCGNLEYLHILWSVNCWFVLWSLGYINCYKASSPGPVKSPSNSIRYNSKKICSWPRRCKTILEIRKKLYFYRWSTVLLFTSFSKTLLTTERRLTGW